MEHERWNRLMMALGLEPNEDTYKALVDAYSEKHRHYHTVGHIEATLKHLDAVMDLAENAVEIEIALWFHDAVYKPFSATNELDSANWACDFLTQNEVSGDVTERVHQLIMATLHAEEAGSQDASLIVDIDLTILGAAEDIYQEFESAIRKEYKLVPYLLYKKKRKEILAGFLERARIYQNDYFFEKLDKQARVNLSVAIAAL